MQSPLNKSCSKCGLVKPAAQFFPDRRNRNGLSSECRSCRIAMTKDWKSKDIEGYRKKDAFRRRQYQFGITASEYEEMHTKQDGKCAICEREETRLHQSGKVKTLAIDHDHSTGIIRELLCGGCNNALGAFYDSPELLEKAAAYLRKHATAPSGKVVPFKREAA